MSTPTPARNWMAVTSLVVSIVATGFLLYGWFLAGHSLASLAAALGVAGRAGLGLAGGMAGVLTGVGARRQIAQRAQTGGWMALTGIIMGATTAGIALFVVIAVLLYLALAALGFGFRFLVGP